MGGALVAGWLTAGYAVEDIVVADPDERQRRRHQTTHGVRTAEHPPGAVAGADVVVIAVKPQQVAEALEAAAPALEAGTLVISIAAGVRLADIEALVPTHPVVRAMPNTPALVGMAATAIAGGERASEEDLRLAEEVLSVVGTVVQLPESDLDAVTGLSGSGPAYLFLVAESMIEAGERNGLAHETAVMLVEQTLRGASELLMRSGDTPAALREAVTSPGGTTEAGLRVLDERGVRDAIVDAISRATERSRELGQRA